MSEGNTAERGPKPGSRLAITLGLVGFFVGATLWFLVPRPFAHYIHGFVFVPIASLGVLCCGVGILGSWRRIGWPLRVLGILLLIIALSPLVLIGSALLSGIMNWPAPR